MDLTVIWAFIIAFIDGFRFVFPNMFIHHFGRCDQFSMWDNARQE